MPLNDPKVEVVLTQYYFLPTSLLKLYSSPNDDLSIKSNQINFRYLDCVLCDLQATDDNIDAPS